ncbi:MAG: EscU/YscU/HrcU family type III secretion system export apparatus switch protein [Bacillota bacterium]
MAEQRLKRAAALAYQPETDQAPMVLAKGERLTAERIVALAEASGVPIIENASLAAALTQLELGKLVPPELYQAVAEVLAFVYRLDDSYGQPKRRAAVKEEPCEPR